MAENLVEVGLEFVNLRLAQVQVGQFRHVADFFFRDLHARAFLRACLYMLRMTGDRKSTRLNSSHLVISYAVFCLKTKPHHAARPTICRSWNRTYRWRAAWSSVLRRPKRLPRAYPPFFFFHCRAPSEIYPFSRQRRLAY